MLLLALGLIALPLDPAAGADRSPLPAADAFRAGVACYQQLDFSCAVDLLTAAAWQAEPADQRRWGRIHRLLAESHLALGQRDEAVAVFVRLLRGRPDYAIDEPGVSPKILAALEQARRQLARESIASRTTAPGAAGPDRPLLLDLTGSAQFLVGRDADRLHTGGGLELALLYRYTTHWLLGGGARWAMHSLAGADRRLHLGAGWAGAGPCWSLGPLELAGVAGLGVGHFGVPQQDSRTALLLVARLSAHWQVHPRLALGLAFAPSGWICPDGPDSSLTFAVGLSTAVRL
jgi:tetratricopeptide (TPR) repeat protein